MHFPTHVAPRGVDAAGVPEGPSRQGGRAGDLGGGGLEKVDLVGRVVVDGAGEEGEEDEEAGAGDQDEGSESEGCACGLVSLESIRLGGWWGFRGFHVRDAMVEERCLSGWKSKVWLGRGGQADAVLGSVRGLRQRQQRRMALESEFGGVRTLAGSDAIEVRDGIRICNKAGGWGWREDGRVKNTMARAMDDGCLT